MSYNISTRSKRLLADTVTPIGIFLRIRDQYPYSVILESADYHAMQNSFSYIACDVMASITIDNSTVTQAFPNGETETFTLKNRKDAVKALREFADAFKAEENPHAFISNGLFGHITYDAVSYFEDIEMQGKSEETAIPQIMYRV